MSTWDEYKAYLKTLNADERKNIEAIEDAAATVLPTRDSMTDAEFNAMMEAGYQQAICGQACPLTELMGEQES